MSTQPPVLPNRAFAGTIPLRQDQKEPPPDPADGKQGYYIHKIKFERIPEVKGTAVVLVHKSEMKTWNECFLYFANHTEPMKVQIQGGTLRADQLPEYLDHITSRLNTAECLMFPTGQRVLLLEDSVNMFHQLLMSTKPLYDEYAMLHTADQKAQLILLEKENFGTYADQVRYRLERKGEMNGFYWMAREQLGHKVDFKDGILGFRVREKKDADEDLPLGVLTYTLDPADERMTE
jgi:hypothetical protein